MTASLQLPEIARVAVIGAGGVSGLTSLAQLLEKGVSAEQIVGLEARAVTGGLWNYEKADECEVVFRPDGLPAARTKAEINDGGVIGEGQSAVYDGLRTNLPAPVMALRKHPFPPGTPLFPHHQQVNKYLQSYAEELGLNKLIRFNTIVRSLKSADESDHSKGWEVVSESRLPNGSVSTATERFSHIMMSNGHYAEPSLPYLPNLWSFPGTLTHSRWWRTPAQFDHQTVLVVGSHASGSDIARELAMRDEQLEKEGKTVNRRIVQSSREGGRRMRSEGEKLRWEERVEEVAEIERVEDGVLVLKDGKRLEGVEVIVFATGYLYSFPFCPPEAQPWKEHPLVEPVTAPSDPSSKPPHDPIGASLRPPGGPLILNLDHADLFYAPNPTLAFLAIHYNTNPFPLAETQARVIAHAWAHRRIPALPPLKRMSDDPTDRHVGAPQEFDNQDAWLEAIGEGKEGAAEAEWGKVSAERRRMRGEALKLRREHLGY